MDDELIDELKMRVKRIAHNYEIRVDNQEVDSDKNGAHNIARRGIGKYNETSSDTRGVVTTPEATTVDPTSATRKSVR